MRAPSPTSRPTFVPALGRSLESVRLTLADGPGTTLRVARFERSRFRLAVVEIEPRSTLLGWCESNGVGEAMIGGFYVRAGGRVLGELRIGGTLRPSVPFDSPWGALRACVHIEAGRVSLAHRSELPAEPGGDLLQAGPMLLSGGESLIRPGRDPEGFSAGSRQFDSDITAGRYPRAALGLSGRDLIAVVCEGRAAGQAGLTLAELAQAMAGLGATEAINLDGGGSASLVYEGRLRNSPRAAHGLQIPGGREVATALSFASR